MNFLVKIFTVFEFLGYLAPYLANVIPYAENVEPFFNHI
jgi:hypothetical protein